MFKSQQKLILYQLNVYNILYIFFLKIFFSEIFYIKISDCLKNLKIIKILKKIKINWLNFQDYDVGESYYRAIKKNIYYSDYISKILVNKIWDEDIKIIYLKKNYLEACLSFKIRNESQKIFQIFEISKILSINGTKISILLHKSFFTKNIKKKYYSNYLFKILPTINFSYLIHSFNLLFLIARALYDKFFSLINFNKNFSLFRKNLRKNKKNKVIYFPHKGIFYLDRLKDQFYSLNKNSPLNKKNITHIEWFSNDIDKKLNQFGR